MDTLDALEIIGSTPTAPPEPAGPPETPKPPPLDPIVLDACLVAVGEREADERAAPHPVWAARRDLNAKGTGDEDYRRVLRAGERSWGWVSDGRLPHGAYLASERHAKVVGDGFRGDLLAAYTRGIRGGRSEGKARLYEIRLIVGKHGGEGTTVKCAHTRRRDGRLDVVVPSGHSLTVASPDW